MFAHISILIILLILMIYYSKRIKYYTTIITIYLFSLILGFESLTHPHTPFSPYFEIFFIIFQTVLFIQIAIDYIQFKK